MYYSIKKKQRGQKRRLEALCRKIDGIVPFAETHRNSELFRVGNAFIGHPKTYSHIKTAFCRKVLEKAERIIAEKPADLPFCKVVALFYPRDLWNSKILIFYDEDFYNHLLINKLPCDIWRDIEGNRSFVKERNIKTSLAEKGYIDRSPSWNGIDEQELWFYGEM